MIEIYRQRKRIYYLNVDKNCVKNSTRACITICCLSKTQLSIEKDKKIGRCAPLSRELFLISLSVNFIESLNTQIVQYKESVTKWDAKGERIVFSWSALGNM
jgi:hypothetical protein